MSKKQNYKVINNLEQKSEEWFAQREGYITGSTAKDVFVKSDKFLFKTLAAMTTPTEVDNGYKGAAIEWGNEQEPYARAAYNTATGRNLQEVGFIAKNDEKAGVSPDGVENPTGIIRHAGEIKCPNTETHIEYIVKGGVPSEHRKQVVHYYYVIDTLQTLDFISYDPRYKYKPLHIVNTKREDFLIDLAMCETVYGKFHEQRDSYYKQLVL